MTDDTADATPGVDPASQPAPITAESADPRADRVAAAVSAWTKHLVDLGGRNTLLWYRDLPTGTLDLTTAHPGGVAMLLAGRPTKLSDLVRESAALGEARRRARTIAAKSRELHEERGIVTGFIAIGMATWREPKASRPPAAPVLLRACTLKAIGAAQEDFTVDLGADVEFNPVLRHYLSSEQGIDIDADGLEEMAGVTGGFDPYPAYAALTKLCATVPDFEVQPRLVIGNFSYAKLPMVADLALQRDTLANHDVIAALAGDADALASVRSELPQGRAGEDDPEREHLILDADSTQQAAIDAVRSGAHLVIKGPPGTGKSQTIANLIATLAGEGKRTLFVAEKRAAIDAVLHRLESAGLSDLVLDLYDGTASRRRLAQEFGASLQRRTETADPDTSANNRELLASRQALTEHVAALHMPREPWGVTAYQAQEAIAAQGAMAQPPRSRVRLRGDALRALSRADVDRLGRDLQTAGDLGAWSTTGAGDPWYGARVTTADEAVTAREISSRLAQGGLDQMQATMTEVFAKVRLPEIATVADWGEVLDTVGRVRDTLEIFRPDVFDIPLDDLVAATGSAAYRGQVGSDLGFFARRRFKKQARSLLRPGTPPPNLHEALIQAQTQRGTWRSMAGGGGRPEMPADLDRANRAYAQLAQELTWLGERLVTTAAGGDLMGTPIAALRERLAALDSVPDRLAVIPTVIGTLDAMQGAGLAPLIEDFSQRGVAPSQARRELDHVWWASIIEEVSLTDPRYGALNGDALRAVADSYAQADREHLAHTAARVLGRAGDRLRDVLADNPQQESLVRAEAGKSRRHRTLRDMLEVAGPTLTAIKPCWAMSPLVVASALPPGQWFDVVIFDEASQIPPAQAISAISRARQIVVAGDERQLPPTSFFTTVTGDEGAAAPEESLTEGFESVLDVLAATLPSRRLAWHYRSRDERLIDFANRFIYDGSLVTFPGASTEQVLSLVHVEGQGVMADGEAGVETTNEEVDRVVQLVLDHARTRPQESLGVIALGIRHATAIEEALRRVLVNTPDVADFFNEDNPAPFFIKNLERVQGDERDAIIVSIGFGKTPRGRVLHRFGPLNLDGGERRLNVAITRARLRMTVVSSLLAEDLDPDRLKARGAMMLRDFLAYAASGGVAPGPGQGLGQGLGQGAGSAEGKSAGAGAVLSEFANRLRDQGLRVTEGFGASAQPIDLVVDDGPSSSVRLAVEADGPAYAQMGTVRDRDRLRGEHLARLGWTPVRVWSADLFRDPAHDVARVVTAVRGVGHLTQD